MAKYIGTYPNAAAIETAVENEELNRPYVALAEDTKTVYYGPYVNLSVVGDIVVYDSVRSDLRFIHYEDYNTTTYPTATYEPIGVVYKKQDDQADDITIISVYNPTLSGAQNYGFTSVYYGQSGVSDIATSSTNTQTNMNELLSAATAQPDWRTESVANQNGSGYSPAACVCWKYHTNGTSQGDWYLPAIDKICDITDNDFYTVMSHVCDFESLNGISLYSLQDSYNCYLCSSTNMSATAYYVVKPYYISTYQAFKTDRNKNSTSYVFPFYTGQILPM